MQKKINFHDTTFRDGSQSLWAMKMRHGAYNAVAEELDEAGFHRIEIPTNALAMKMMVRTLKENPYETFKIFKNKIRNTRKTFGTGAFIDMMVPNVSRDMLDLYHGTLQKHAGLTDCWSIVATKDEVKRDLPIVIPSIRKFGLKWTPAVAYTVSPRHTDEFFAKVVRDCMKYKPSSIMLKDAGGLLTPERVKTLVPAMMKEAPHLDFEIHSHGMSTYEPAVLVECMKLGVKTFHTCVRPLAFGSSHCAIDTAVKNAEVLGYRHGINLQPLEEVERKLTMIAKEENMPIGAPLEYDEEQYIHMIPGGVISNLMNQLEILGIKHRLRDVLDEIPKIHQELGYPTMITPHSQFIVAQAAVNVATGERYKQVLDCMVEYSMGIYGVEDTGLENMDQNLKDKFLSMPSVQRIAENNKKQTERQLTETVDDVRASYGMLHASDEEFLLAYIMGGKAEIDKMYKAGPPKSYYTGREPLALLLQQLSKDHDISRLEMKS